VAASFVPRGGSFVLGFVLGGELATRSPRFAGSDVADSGDVSANGFPEDAPAVGELCF